MKRLLVPDAPIQRRHVLLLAAAGITGCGGGSDSGTNTGALPGTGGTGIYAAGPISGFGSVILKGIRFDDQAASAAGRIMVDGMSVTSDALRLGMIASVAGEQQAGQTGQATASSIEVWSIARGRVTQVASGGLLTVAGMSVQTDANTVFDGIAGATYLREDMGVVVWGLQAGANGWTATRLARVSDLVTTAATGRVTFSDGHWYVNELRLMGAATATLTAGAWVRVQGQSADGERLALESVQPLQGDGTTAVREGALEIEGYATSELHNGQFQMGQWLVDVSAISPPVSITLGEHLEVSGNYAGGVLRAQSVVPDDDTGVKEVEIEARIESYTSLASFVLRGQRCDASGAAIPAGVVQSLAQGVKVRVIGRAAGDVLLVDQLELA
ncbi:MAG: DUF5666 domain-containing protein [Rhodoferax sp.]